MTEIRIHGRGGQGGVTLAKIIATARFLGGDSVQAFGLYAAERSGAPVQAFCRFDDKPITNRNLIYEPDHVIVLDPTLVGSGIDQGLAPGGYILINTPEPPEKFAETFPRQRIATVDATAIARDHGLGTRSVPIVNTALAGAVGAMLGIPLDRILAALDHLGFGGGNVDAAREAFEKLRKTDAPREAAPAAPRGARPVPVTPRAPSLVEGAGGELPRIKTGTWAKEQPRRQRLVPPCNHVCPAGNDVQGFLQELAHDRIDAALEILLRTTPLPATCGRVCPAPCMDNCNRSALDGAVNVRQLERLAGDEGKVEVRPLARRDERVAIVGSGPAGLSAAYQLARFGYRVTVYEAGPKPGGLLRTGIPEFRLPEAVLDRELERITGLGVEIVTGRRVGKSDLLGIARENDAVLVATGLQELRSLRLGTGDGDAVIQGIDFLDRARRGELRVDGEEVIVVGGGNTAMDAARSALRLGARNVRVVYRRSRKEMPAIREEIEEALAEGIVFNLLTQPVALRERNGGDTRYLLTCRRMELGEPDESGRRRPVEVPGSDFELPCDRVILALGQSPDLSVFPEGTEVREGTKLIGVLETPVYAVGDLATNDGTVAGAIGSGRRTALHIHRLLGGEAMVGVEQATPPHGADIWRDTVIRADAMKLHLFERRPPAAGRELSPEERRRTFDEIHAGLPDAGEAKRCLSCGVCNECDMCVTYCPEGVLKRVGHEFHFDYAYCKGCGVCVTECPRNVIFMSQM
ncbi:MAG: FAD-dependent oxidoreductase [Acidobacteria bacterium]|nr:MAG: FAD-dependent oxidoreductase [Acidobacteriota bacterium]